MVNKSAASPQAKQRLRSLVTECVDILARYFWHPSCQGAKRRRP